MLEQALEFLLETEKLKGINRVSRPLGLERRENSAEHSWTLALTAMTMIPLIAPELDKLRVIEMLLLHDIVEIDAGDTFCYADQTGKFDREIKAAERIYGMLPEELGDKYKEIWLEFEERKTKESQFANAIDRLFPLLQNFHAERSTWVENNIDYDQVFERNKNIAEGSEQLWEYVKKMLEVSVEKGLLIRK